MHNYTTWYEFKRDLEKKTGRVLFNNDWLQLKPQAPLPWSASHFRSVFKKTGKNRIQIIIIKTILPIRPGERRV